MGSIKDLVTEIDTIYWSAPKDAKLKIQELIQAEIDERVRASNLHILRELGNDFRIMVRELKKEIITDIKPN